MPTQSNQAQMRSAKIALIGSTRPYRSAEVLEAFVQNGFTVVERPCDAGIVNVASSIDPDVIVLAIQPNRESDRAVISRLAAATGRAIVVLGPGQVSAGFADALVAGADVCVSETHGFGQLLAQVEAIRRRTRRENVRSAEEEALSVSDLHIDPRRCAVEVGGKHVAVPPMEFKILSLLARNAGKVLSTNEIFASLHEYEASPQEARDSIKVYVRRIRQRLAQVAPTRDYIVNVRGFGYMLSEGDSAKAPGEAGRDGLKGRRAG